uniref:Uncharacterized protein n=1 Tax=viral metagenome TaxID=1070528 RepID=A0A6C0IFL1_9ZZZZ
MNHTNDILIFKYILLFAFLGICFIFFVPFKSIEKYTNYSQPIKSKWSDDDWLLSDTPDISGTTIATGATDTSGTTITPGATDTSGTTITPGITKKLSHFEYDRNINQDNSLDFQGEYSIPILAPTPPVLSSTSLVLGGPADYAPSYNNTVNFSKLSGFSYSSPITDSNDVNGGFCSFNKKNPEQLEYQCNQLNKDTCASTSCCVLLGGSKCVYGNKNGVYMKANYTDPSILNKDRYYYLGNCYGNCVNSQGSNQPLVPTLRPTTTPTTLPTTPPTTTPTTLPSTPPTTTPTTLPSTPPTTTPTTLPSTPPTTTPTTLPNK